MSSAAVAERNLDFWTHSMMQTYMNCPRRGHYRYGLGLVKAVEHKSLLIGAAFHKGMETGTIEAALATFDKLMPRPNDQGEADRLAADRTMVEGMVSGGLHAWTRHEGGQREVQFRVPIRNPETGATSRSFQLAGKIDGIVDVGSQWRIEEYKTSGDTSKLYFDRLQLDQQVTLYVYAAQRQWDIEIASVIYRVARKPSIKQTAKETPAQFEARLLADYQDRPDFYFHEVELTRTPEQLAEFESDLWIQTQRHLADRRAGFHPKNTSKCADYGGCPYMPLCLGTPDAEALYTIREPHSELGEDETHE